MNQQTNIDMPESLTVVMVVPVVMAVSVAMLVPVVPIIILVDWIRGGRNITSNSATVLTNAVVLK